MTNCKLCGSKLDKLNIIEYINLSNDTDSLMYKTFDVRDGNGDKKILHYCPNCGIVYANSTIY